MRRGFQRFLNEFSELMRGKYIVLYRTQPRQDMKKKGEKELNIEDGPGQGGRGIYFAPTVKEAIQWNPVSGELFEILIPVDVFFSINPILLESEDLNEYLDRCPEVFAEEVENGKYSDNGSIFMPVVDDTHYSGWQVMIKESAMDDILREMRVKHLDTYP